jgi:hypothetical protein
MCVADDTKQTMPTRDQRKRLRCTDEMAAAFAIDDALTKWQQPSQLKQDLSLKMFIAAALER